MIAEHHDDEAAKTVHGHGRAAEHGAESGEATPHGVSARNMRLLLIVAALLVIAVAIFLRSGMLKYQGLFEPDGFYYYSIVKETVANNLIVPSHPPLSGFPNHNLRGEQPGLVYLTVLPYMLLQYLGIGYLSIMRLLPVLFAILYMVLTYFIVKHISDSRVLGLLAMFLVAVSSGNIARTAALVYRGDSFVALPLLVALLFMLKALKGGRHRTLNVLAFSVALSTGILLWTGSPYIIAVVMLSLLLLIGYGFVTARKELVETNIMLTGGLLLTYALEHLYVFVGATRAVSQLYRTDFLLLYLPILLASLLALYLVRIKSRFAILESTNGRALIMLAIALAATAIVYFPLNSYMISNISGVPLAINTTGGAMGATTQELQRPTLDFLYASFNLQLYLVFAGLIAFLLLSNKFGNADSLRIKGLTLNMNVGFIVVFAYLVVTGYMQSLAIRYNATVSIPLAIFAAYSLYAAWELAKDRIMEGRLAVPSAAVCAVISAVLLYLAVTRMGTPPMLTLLLAGVALSTAVLAYAAMHEARSAMRNKTKAKYTYIAAAAVADVVLVLLIMITGMSNSVGSMLTFFASCVVLVAALLAYCTVYAAYGGARKSLKLEYFCIGLVAAILAFNFYNTYIASITAAPADGINDMFLSAMSWMSNNTPANATVVAVWPDGSVVEAWGNRASYTDSVGGEDGPRIERFSQYLFNTSPDTGYLYSVDKPDYLVARGFWYQELGGLAVEGQVQNSSAFGFVMLNSLQVTHNATTQIYSFSSTTSSYRAMMLINPSVSNGVSAYIGGNGNGGMAPIKRIMFYDQANYNYSTLESTLNTSLNYTLLVSYYNRTITGGTILGTKLPASNLFRFTFLCNYYECPYGDNNVSMRAVFINNDTRILKINYK